MEEQLLELANKVAALESATAATMGEAPAGYVSIAFAEKKWAEREAVFSQQLAQLQAQLDNVSEAGDDLEVLEDDEVWGKVEKGKRKSIFKQAGARRTEKLRAGLGKVSSTASPFKKA